jgi:DNA (cytosine-5)-methyltransferase 1
MVRRKWKIMRHGSLFSGIGGFDLAALWCGWTNVFQCENDPFCQQILKYHFPNTILYEDIKTTNFKRYKGTIDIVSGGFPCQPFSTLGKRMGTEDNRFLWYEMLRGIHEIQPTWVVAENVCGILTQENGLVFETICSDMEKEGYNIQPFIIPACSVNAPHQRKRVWFVANRIGTMSENMRQKRKNTTDKLQPATDTIGNRLQKRKKRSWQNNKENDIQYAPNSDSVGLQERKTTQTEKVFIDITRIPSWEEFPTEQPICWRNDGLSERLDGITFSNWNNQSIKAFGNAIVPQVAYQIFKTIEDI